MTLPAILLFIAIPATVLLRKDLTATDKIIYGLLRFYQHGNDCCWPGLKELAEAAGCSVRAVSSSIGRLEADALITVERAYRQNNVYVVKMIADATYLRVPVEILRTEGLSALGKLIAAALVYKAAGKGRAWPHQETLAAELGCSRRSVIRAIEELETSGKLEVHHGGGGRKRGNEYRPTAAFYRAILARGTADRVTKVRPLRKQTEPEDLKRTGAVENVSSACLSGCRRIESPGTPEDRAFGRLVEHGVHRTIAESLVYDQHHPAASVEQAIDNALVRQAVHRQKGDDRFRAFKLAAYVVGSLNQARREASLIKPSRLFVQAKARHDRAELHRREAWRPLSESEFEQRRRRCLEQLRAAAG
jgi:DNA-binding Lrp family transcriptional regulator